MWIEKIDMGIGRKDRYVNFCQYGIVCHYDN
jgi:hypothetical protein